MFQITKEFCFEAAHALPHLPAGHKCARLHGHSYRVVLVLEAADLNADGFVRDYAALDVVKEYLDRQWDHHDLNAIIAGPTTAERLARWLFIQYSVEFPELAEVRVSETAKTWASFRARP